ncbi:prolyl oligopeptidase family serine peptidase [Fulvivirga sp. M361]|uniref:fibronectin type III domain-containing protein n=1 Tax=Fulvivirga sp. M361 TaxID=2594266 RepID=UPI001179ED23|nr:fibronectin type III domain-containing protein [Fulvivirga sp. M361]TRX60121.1 prolyl oligopeptidase family serine peptidase [Fulvivirga sp. M361]
MRNIYLPICILLLFASSSYAQNTRNYSLQPGTKSWRTNPDDETVDPSGTGDYTDTYYGAPSGAMTNWNSGQYTFNSGPRNGTTITVFGEGHLQYDVDASTKDGDPSTRPDKMNYRLMFPLDYVHREPSDPDFYEYPMIVMLHGAGERAHCWRSCYDENDDPKYKNNDHNLSHGGRQHRDAVIRADGLKAEDAGLHPRAFPGFVFFPQAQSGWIGNQRDHAIRIIELLTDSLNIDKNRIYVHGLSNGGFGSWKILDRRPDLFAAALPMSATIPAHDINYEKVAHIPIWTFQGGRDDSPSPNQTRTIVSNFEAEGGIIRYTEYPTLRHGTWNTAYGEDEFFSWMLKQNKANIHVYFGDSTICTTSNQGVRLGVSSGFDAYEWEKDGMIMTDSIDHDIYAFESGTYRVRYRRESTDDWNRWSDPVTLTERTPIVPTITANSSTILPDINNADTVILQAPSGHAVYDWYKDGVSLGAAYADSTTIEVTESGVYSVVVSNVDACPSLPSNTLDVVFNGSAVISAPTTPVALPASSTSINVFWTDNSDNETGFEIYRSTTAGGPYVLLTVASADAIGHVDSNLIPNTTYYYVIRAINNQGGSPFTSEVNTVTNADSDAPDAPANLEVTSNTINSISLRWSHTTDRSGISGYEIFGGPNIESVSYPDSVITITGLTINTYYNFNVVAIDLAGNRSTPSSQVTGSTFFGGLTYEHSTDAYDVLPNFNNIEPEFTGTINNFSLAPRTQDDFYNFRFDGFIFVPTNGTYTFYTTSDDGSALYINPNDDSNAYDPNINNALVDNDGLHGMEEQSGSIFLTAGGHPITVTFFERTRGAGLEVRYEGPGITKRLIPDEALISGEIVNILPPTAPNSLLATSRPSEFSIDVGWNHDTPASVQTEIYRGTSSGGPYEVVHTSNLGELTFVDTELEPSVTYYYVARSINTDGESDFSTEVSATVIGDGVPPSQPTDLTVLTIGPTSVGLSWSPSTDNVGVSGYTIYDNGVEIGSTSGRLSSNGRSGSKSNLRTLASTPATSILIADLTEDTEYNFSVVAQDPAGNTSPNSETVTTTTTGGTPLPVEFIEFKASIASKGVWLTWATGSEVNNDFFTVERSVNSIDFTSIGKVNGAGDSFDRIDYEFLDRTPIRTATYRIKQTDRNGDYDYSKPIIVTFNVENKIQLYPNPTDRGEFTLKGLVDGSDQPITVKLLDYIGREYISRSYEVDEFSRGVEISYNSGVPAGIYVVLVNQGSEVIQKKLVIK